MSDLLHDKLAEVQRRHVMVNAITGVALFLGYIVVALSVQMLLDWTYELPFSARLALLAMHLLVLAAAFTQFLIRPLYFGPDPETLALWVEHAEPRFNSRLIASIQLALPGAVAPGMSQSLVTQTILQTESLAGQVDFSRIIPTTRMNRLAVAALAILLLGSLAFAAGGHNNVDLLCRALLLNVPVPRKTQIQCLTGNVVIARGESVTLAARAAGVIPESGTVLLSYPSGITQQFTLDVDPMTPAQFVRRIDNVQESFRYIIHLNDATTSHFDVRAAQRPSVVSVECRQIFPRYLNRPPLRRLPGDLALLMGSHLDLSITANKPVKIAKGADPVHNRIHLHGSDLDFPLAVDPRQPNKLSTMLVSEFGLPIPAGTTGFSIHLVDNDALASKDPAVYRIDLIPDKPPTARITWPTQKDATATRSAAAVIGFEAADDFALAKVSLKYKINQQPPQAIELQLDGTPQTLRRRFEWPLSKLTVAEGAVIDYWIEAEDSNDVTGPGIGASEHFKIRIVSDADKRAELMSRLGDYLQQIDNTGRSQEELNSRLGVIILQKLDHP